MGIGGGIDYYTIRLTDMNDNAWEFNSYDYYHKDTNERYVYTLESDYNKFLLGRYDYETLEVETQRD